MKKLLVAALVALTSLGVVGVPAANATSEYFYFQNTLGVGGQVSGVPRGSLFFVGAYSSSGDLYCVADQPGSNPNEVKYEVCGGGSSVTTSFASQSGRGQLANRGPNTGKFTAEERW